MGSPRIDAVFRLWQRDKKNHGWRGGPPLTVPCQSFDLLPGLHPPVKSVSTKKEYCLASEDARSLSQNFGLFKTTIRSNMEIELPRPPQARKLRS